MSLPRHSTGILRLDQALGGGIIPGTLTVVMGATGIGKTQLGVTYAHAGIAQEGQSGILFDLTTRGDSQNQTEYAQRMFGWKFRQRSFADVFAPKGSGVDGRVVVASSTLPCLPVGGGLSWTASTMTRMATTMATAIPAAHNRCRRIRRSCGVPSGSWSRFS